MIRYTYHMLENSIDVEETNSLLGRYYKKIMNKVDFTDYDYMAVEVILENRDDKLAKQLFRDYFKTVASRIKSAEVED